MDIETYQTLRTETGNYRARIVRDQDAVNPREDFEHAVHVITIDTHCGKYINVDEDGGPLEWAWERIKGEMPDHLAVETFKRYARIFHGATVFESFPHYGAASLWYITAEDMEREGFGDPAAYIEAEHDEYRAWAEGECFGFHIEERVVYKRAEPTGDAAKDWRWEWESIDSLWGIYGYDWAKSMAQDALDSLAAEEVA